MWLALLVACQSQPPYTGPFDARPDLPPVTDGTERFLSSEEMVPPGEERQFCTFFTWDAGDVGIHATRSYQDGLFGHHAVLLTTIVSDYQQPDGSTMDCTSAEDLSMAQTDTLYVPLPLEPGITGMTLPDGFAVRLEEGTRLVLQSHYINWSEGDILVQDAVDLVTMPPDTVTTWAAAFAHTTIDLELPPQQETEVTIDCAWDHDVTLLYMLGHMHELGAAISVDHQTASGTTRIYDVPAWSDGYRDAPPILEFAGAEMTVAAGDRFLTTCRWDNDTDAAVLFPQEMCVSVGIAYPSMDPLYCAELRR